MKRVRHPTVRPSCNVGFCPPQGISITGPLAFLPQPNDATPDEAAQAAHAALQGQAGADLNPNLEPPPELLSLLPPQQAAAEGAAGNGGGAGAAAALGGGGGSAVSWASPGAETSVPMAFRAHSDAGCASRRKPSLEGSTGPFCATWRCVLAYPSISGSQVKCPLSLSIFSWSQVTKIDVPSLAAFLRTPQHPAHAAAALAAGADAAAGRLRAGHGAALDRPRAAADAPHHPEHCAVDRR